MKVDIEKAVQIVDLPSEGHSSLATSASLKPVNPAKAYLKVIPRNPQTATLSSSCPNEKGINPRPRILHPKSSPNVPSSATCTAEDAIGFDLTKSTYAFQTMVGGILHVVCLVEVFSDKSGSALGFW